MPLPRLALVALAILSLGAAPATRPAPPAWWTDARFGLFIHWGLYAVPAGRWPGKAADTHYSGGLGEWLQHDAKIPVADYAALAQRFNPTAFDADAWADLAQAAGMRYVVLTAKHHDGFALFRTAVDRFNIVDGTPFKRDPTAELAAACRRRGLKFGLYYSQAQDWHHPGGAAAGGHWDAAQNGDFDAYLRTVAEPQVRELIAQYDPAVIWWDTPFDMTAARAAPLAALLSPGIVSNDRLGGGVRADYATPEQTIPANGYPGGRPWETCMTINDTWGFKTDDRHFKPAVALARDLIDIASKGGNFLLNVGPDATGVIPPEEADRLRTVGGWLARNGTAIYGTTAGPFARQPSWGRVTRRGDRLYLHVFDRPADGVLRLPLHNGVAAARLLPSPLKLAKAVPLGHTSTDAGVTVSLPAELADPIATVVELTLDGPPRPFTPAVRPAADGTVTLLPTDAVIDGDTARVEDRDGHADVGFWTDAHDLVRWTADLPPGRSYAVELTYSSEAASRVAVGGTTVAVGPTGGWDRYRTVVVGTVRSAGPAATTVALARPAGTAAVNVRRLRLVERAAAG